MRGDLVVSLAMGVLRDVLELPEAGEISTRVVEALEALSRIPTESGETIEATDVELVPSSPGVGADFVARSQGMLLVTLTLLRGAEAIYASQSLGWCTETMPPAQTHPVPIGDRIWRVCDHSPSHKRPWPKS